MGLRAIKELTVVYSIIDGDKFEAEEMPHLQGLFKRDDGMPFRIHGMSFDDEMHRCTLIEEAIERSRGDWYAAVDVIREILACPDLETWKWES